VKEDKNMEKAIIEQCYKADAMVVVANDDYNEVVEVKFTPKELEDFYYNVREDSDSIIGTYVMVMEHWRTRHRDVKRELSDAHFNLRIAEQKIAQLQATIDSLNDSQYEEVNVPVWDPVEEYSDTHPNEYLAFDCKTKTLWCACEDEDEFVKMILKVPDSVQLFICDTFNHAKG
jgi:hypothetical protein